MNAIPTTMPAVAYRKSLPVDDVESLLDLELPVPAPGPRDLLVQVEAIAVNPVDYKIRENADPGGEPPDQQHNILTQVAQLVDEGAIVSTATRDLGPINAGNLREAHRLQASGTTIGKLTLAGF